MVTRAKTGTFKPKLFSVATTTALIEPATYKQAMHSPEWQKAMTAEFEALQKNNTWILVPPLDRYTVIGCKWVYKLKLKPNGSLEWHEARL